MAKERNKEEREEVFTCPVGRFFAQFERSTADKSEFFNHLNQSRVEFLKAVRSLVDERIEHLEGKNAKKQGRKATRIKVE